MTAPATAFLVLTSAPQATGPPLLTAGAGKVPVRGNIWKLIAGKNQIGRLPGPDIAVVLPWGVVSRKHAVIEWFHPGAWEIEDVQSRNGTLVNGQKLPPQTLTPLHDGDRIQVGITAPTPLELMFCYQLQTAGAAAIEYTGGALEGLES